MSYSSFTYYSSVKAIDVMTGDLLLSKRTKSIYLVKSCKPAKTDGETNVAISVYVVSPVYPSGSHIDLVVKNNSKFYKMNSGSS